MSENWYATTVGELCKVKHGWAFKGEYFSSEGKYLLLTPGNFIEDGGLKIRGDKEKYYIGDFPKDFLLDKGDLLVVMTDLIQSAPILGGSAIVPCSDKFLHNQRLGKVTVIAPEICDKYFLYYFFNYDGYRQQIRGSASGATVRHTAPERIYKCKINLPPLPTQQKIAAILSAYDDLIENNNKRIKLLEELAQITYEEWFVRMKFPNHETTPIDEATGLPVGWERKPLSSLADFLNGFAFKPSHLGDTGMPIIKIKELKNGISTDTPRNTGIEIPKKYLVNSGDILFSWSASLEVVLWSNGQGLLNQHLFKVTPINSFSRAFVYLVLKNSLSTFDGLTTGATMKHIKRSELDFVTALVPTKDVLEKFTETLEQMLNAMLNLQNQNQRLKEARDLLLPRLMSGVIDVDSLIIPMETNI